MTDGLRLAVEAKGSIAALARAIGITRAAICQWDKVPAERVLQIEAATGVPRDKLRPDLYAAAVARPETATLVPDAEPELAGVSS